MLGEALSQQSESQRCELATLQQELDQWQKQMRQVASDGATGDISPGSAAVRFRRAKGHLEELEVNLPLQPFLPLSLAPARPLYASVTSVQLRPGRVCQTNRVI